MDVDGDILEMVRTRAPDVDEPTTHDGDARAAPPTVESLARREEPPSMNKTELVAKSTRVER
jgi:hypothetical protein